MQSKKLFLASAFCSVWCSSATAGLLFIGDFESGTRPSSAYLEACCSHSSSIVSSPARDGRYAHRIELRKNDPDQGLSKRVEFTMKWNNEAGGVGSERWFGFSIFIPADWINDNAGAGELVWQTHTHPDACESAGRNPAASLVIDQGNWVYVRRSDPNACSPSNSIRPTTHALGAMEKGKWTDFVIHVKWSYLSDGITQVWKNGELVLDHQGPNYYNDQTNGYIKFGLYKWGWKEDPSGSIVSTRVLYHDEMRIGDESSSYGEVAPGGVSSPEPAPAPVPAPAPAPAPEPEPEPAPIPDDVELVANGGFESGLTGWANWDNSVASGSSPLAGFQSLRVGTGAGGVGQNIPLSESPAGRSFVFKASGRTSVAGDAAWVGVNFLSGGRKAAPSVNLEFSSSVASSKSAPFTVPAGIDQLQIFVWKEASSGYLLVDSISLAEVEDEAAEPAPAPSPSLSPSPSPVGDTVKPIVEVTSPVEGARVAVRSKVTLTASATDDVGVVKVELLVNGSLICTDTVAPYSCVWSVPRKAGRSYNLKARAYDRSGNLGASPVITVISQ